VIKISGRKKSKKADTRAPIDEILKYLFGVSKETLINMLNSLFKKKFSVEGSTILQTNSEFVDEAFDIIRGDLFYVVSNESKSYHFHIELQTRPDGHMTIRILSYDIKKATENQRLENKSGIARYILPKTIVIHIEKSNSIPDNYEFELVDIKDDGSEEVIRRVVPVIKYWELTEKDLIEQQLYPLLPLQIFLLRGELKKYADEKDSENKRQLIQQIKQMTEKIIVEVKNLAETGKINQGDDDRIVTALGRLIKYLNEQYNFDNNLNKEVNTMIESVFTTLEKRGIERGRKEGLKEGKKEGRKEGANKTKIAIAEKMILNYEPLNKIKEYSGLTEIKIRQLAKKLSKEIVIQ